MQLTDEYSDLQIRSLKLRDHDDVAAFEPFTVTKNFLQQLYVCMWEGVMDLQKWQHQNDKFSSK